MSAKMICMERVNKLGFCIPSLSPYGKLSYHSRLCTNPSSRTSTSPCRTKLFSSSSSTRIRSIACSDNPSSPAPRSKREETSVKSQARGSTLLLVGLGNPGASFEDTPHNIGFSVVTNFARSLRAPDFKLNKSLQAYHTTCHCDDIKLHIIKPMTFMNLSGRSVASTLNYFKISPAALLVVTDDISLETGRLRLRAKGSAGGHNGLKSIQSSLGGCMEYARLKVGVGSPKDSAYLKDYVLRKFTKAEKKIMDSVEIDALNVLQKWVDETDIIKVMNYTGMLSK